MIALLNLFICDSLSEDIPMQVWHETVNFTVLKFATTEEIKESLRKALRK